jgi:phosphoglucosamine mutase
MRLLAGRPLADAIPMEKLPQKLVNVRVRDRDALEGSAAITAAVDREAQALEGRGRVLLRPSGTEPVVRVMVEAPDAAECEAICGRLTELVGRELS